MTGHHMMHIIIAVDWERVSETGLSSFFVNELEYRSLLSRRESSMSQYQKNNNNNIVRI